MRSLRGVIVGSLFSWPRGRRFACVWLLLFGRCLSARRRSRGRRGAANPAAPVRGGMASRFSSARAAGLLSTAVVLVDRGPGATFGLLLRNAAALVALLDMLRFPVLLVGVFRLVSPRHGPISCAARIIQLHNR